MVTNKIKQLLSMSVYGFILISSFLGLGTNLLYSQGIGISDVSIVADPSSILELRSTTKGVLIPRLTTIERDLIPSPALGLLIFNTTTAQFNYYEAGWKVIATSTTNLTGEITSVGNASSLGAFTSSSLSTALTDETGTANSVFSDSPTFTGIPLAPTATLGTNTDQLASTAFVLANAGGYFSAEDVLDITTSSTTDTAVTGMSVSPTPGTYSVNFNGQCGIPDAIFTTGVNTSDLKADLNLIYTDIVNLTVTNTTHALSFGSVSGETIGPGVYSLAGAITLAETLILDGGGDSDALFVIRASAAFDVTAGATVSLINGASSENVFWVAEGAIGIGATTNIPGTIFSNSGAIAVGTGCTISGRLLAKNGALAFGAGSLSIPTNPSSHVDLRSVAPFVLFTGSGAVANSGASTYTGDIGTDLGAITGFGGSTVNGTIFQAGATAVVTSINHTATFSFYLNGILISNSVRTLLSPGIVSLHCITTITTGDTLDVRWKMDAEPSDSGQIGIGNKVLSLIKI
jgi:hypothetical protein